MLIRYAQRDFGTSFLLFFGLIFSFFILYCGIAVSEELPVCSGCHKKQVQGKELHPVIKTKGCVSCHTKPHSKAAKPAKFLFATGVDLCWGCHNKAQFTQQVKHPPVAAGQCTACHDVHGSEYPKLLVVKMPDLCFTCHDKAKFMNKTTHPPVAGGMCTSCHDPHSSVAARLLVSAPPGLCFNCHDKQKFSGKKDVHSPVAKGLCTSCHEPHASSAQKLLLGEPPVLCFNCHNKYGFERNVKHSPVAAGMCMSCHAPHQADAAKLLLQEIPGLCFSCHDKKDFSRKNLHQPVAAGMCMSCHRPHFSDQKKLLPLGLNELCLQCHPQVAVEPHAVSGVNVKKVGHPLESKRVKVVDGKKVKLSCVSCHRPHSSDWIRLFRYQAVEPLDICHHCHRKH